LGDEQFAISNRQFARGKTSCFQEELHEGVCFFAFTFDHQEYNYGCCNGQRNEVYNVAFKLAMDIFKLSKTFPREETYSLTDHDHREVLVFVCWKLTEKRDTLLILLPKQQIVIWRIPRLRGGWISRLPVRI
jgi:hypothetical protein